MKTDSQLQQDVIAELKWEPSVQATDIGVEVKDGVVTLAGSVGSYSEKLAAQHAAQRIYGVKALATEIKVQLSTSPRTDADIARSVKNVLEWSSALPQDSVAVLVESGWVTLTGQVDWQFQRQAAADSVRFLLGVTGVSDQIVLKPQVTATTVKADIEATLKRHATADAKLISATVHGSKVTLRGKVPNWTERELAVTAAWGTPGVHSVVDEMEMTYG